MAVDVGGRADVAVSHPCLHILQIAAVVEQNARAAMPQLVEANMRQSAARCFPKSEIRKIRIVAADKNGVSCGMLRCIVSVHLDPHPCFFCIMQLYLICVKKADDLFSAIKAGELNRISTKILL